jgi:hypothetical protein
MLRIDRRLLAHIEWPLLLLAVAVSGVGLITILSATHHSERLLSPYVVRQAAFGLHVHVGVSSAEKAIACADGLRRFIPELLALSANSPVAAAGAPKREIRNNQYGFSLGGPIVHNKTFFFSTLEVQKLTAGNTKNNLVSRRGYQARR